MSWVRGARSIPGEAATEAVDVYDRDESEGPGLPALVCRTLELVARGLTTDEAAARLEVSPGVVRRHLASAIVALGARSKLEAIVAALRLGLIDPFGSGEAGASPPRPDGRLPRA
jgi:DNA-binding NarL/FixJ family response regulator